MSWIGPVPAHWSILRLKHAVRRIVGGSTPASGEDSYWDGGVTWVTPADISNRERLTSSSRTISRAGLDSCSAELVPAGSLVITTRAPIGNVALARVELCTNQGCKTLLPSGVLSEEFALRLFQILKPELQSLGTGTTFTELSTNALGSLPIPAPPKTEQAAIVRFLDHVDQRIRRAIRAKQKLIALLNEQKQAVIHRAVTRGLDPNVRLRPSGVEWLGDVPEHWSVMPLKRAFQSMTYGISESGTDYGSIRLLAMGDVRDGQVVVPDAGGVHQVDPHLLLQENDLLFNRTNSLRHVGKVGLFVGSDTPVTFASYLVRMRARQEHDPEYLNLLLNDVSVRSIARREAIPSLHQANLNPTRFGRLHIALPGRAEQSAIASFVRSATANFDRAIAGAERTKHLLAEYRARLISDLVTGKVDVREAAARLPHDAAEPEPDEEIEAEDADVDVEGLEAVEA